MIGRNYEGCISLANLKIKKLHDTVYNNEVASEENVSIWTDIGQFYSDIFSTANVCSESEKDLKMKIWIAVIVSKYFGYLIVDHDLTLITNHKPFVYMFT